MDLFDNDVLGTSNVRITPEFPAVKKSWRSLRTWYIILPVVLMVLVLGFLFIQQDILYGITDKIVNIYASSVGTNVTAEADEALEVYTVANKSIEHEADVDDEHCCLCCGEKLEHKDENGDHICDYAACSLRLFDGVCEDADKDHNCDAAGCPKKFGECKDISNNHFCDYCQEKLTNCQNDGDHHCGICGNYIACADRNNDGDHVCDYGCGAVMSVCTDVDKDHACDYDTKCSQAFGVCEDANKDHKCDYGCKETFGLEYHKDDNRDHKCDYGSGCKQAFGAHCDSDIDHICDYGCITRIGSHIDANADHKCDYGCEFDLSVCYDENFDLVCDLCGAPCYPIWLALAFWAIPFILIEIVCLIIWFAKKRRLGRISIEFYKDIIIYRDGDTEVMRTFNGTYNVAVRQDTLKERRGNYGTVTIFCPGGPAMSMVFSRIDNPHGLAAQLRAMRPKENTGIATTYPESN